MEFQLKNLIYLLPLFGSVPAFSAGCEAAVGDWKWFNGGVVSVQQNQTIAMGGKPAGKWECTNAARSLLTLRWAAGFLDTLTVTGDRMSGKNKQGVTVSGTRINKAKTGK